MASSDLRVLLVTPDFPPELGGIAIFLSRLAQSLPTARVRVLALGQEGAAENDRDSGLDVRRAMRPGLDHRLAVVGLNAQAIAEARRFRPHVVLSGHVVGSLGAMLLRRALRVPFVQYVHADEFRLRARLTTAAVRTADATIAVSRHTGDMALEAGAGSDRVRVIHPGIDLPDGVSADRGPEPVLVTVASLIYRYKGHDVVTRALPLIRARVPEVRWVVIGDGPIRGTIESAIAAYDLGGSVELLGRVDDEVRNGWLDRATAFCMISRLPAAGLGGEGFGTAYMEAAARCLPSIGGDVAGARDSIVDGRTGVLVDPTDHLAFAAAATDLLLDRGRTEQMGVAARAWAEEHAWPLIAAQTEEVLREVAGRRAGR